MVLGGSCGKIGGYGGYGPIRVTGSGPLLVQVPKWSMWVPTCRHMKGKVVAPCWQICCWHAKILVRAPGRAMRDVAAIMVTSPWITGCIWSERCLHVRKLRFSVHSTVVCTCSRCQVKVFVSHSANHPFFLDRSRIRDAERTIGCTDTFAGSMPRSLIMKQGGWTSDAVDKYNRLSVDQSKAA